MFNIGDLMVYGTNGVCRVTDISTSPFDAADTRSFYVLHPLSDRANLVIYTPVDNLHVVMRPLVSADDARALIERLPSIEKISVDIEKRRRDTYREIIQSGEIEAYARIIKTVAIRREEFRKTRRRLPDLDNDFEHTAKNCLYGELSEVLSLSREEVHSIVSEGLSRMK